MRRRGRCGRDRWGEDGNAGAAEGSGEVQGSAIDADDSGGLPGGVDQSFHSREMNVGAANAGEDVAGGRRSVHHEAVAIGREQCGDFRIIPERPLLRDPSGQGAGQDEALIGEFAFGAAGRDGELARELTGSGGLGEFEVLIDDVW